MAAGRGLEFGSYAYKAAVVRTGSSGLVVEDLWIKPRPLAAEGPAGEDPAWRSEARKLAGSNALFAVGGRDLMVRFSKFPVVPPWRLQMMVSFELEQAAGRAKMDVVDDYMLVNPPSGPSEGLTVMSVLARKEAVEQGMEKAGGAGFRCRGGVPVPLALFYAYRGSTLYDPDKTALLVDVGYETTSIAACFAGRVFFTRSVNEGMLRLVRAVNDALGVGVERAEAFLRERIDLSTRAPEGASVQLKQAHQAASGSLTQYCGQVASTLRVAGQQLSLKQELAVDKLVLSGGGLLLPGVREALERAFGLNATVLALGEQIPLGAKVNPGLAGPQAVVAVGLAAAAAREADIVLVPPTVVRRRDFWRRRILYYLTPIAAMLLAALTVLAATKRLGRVEERLKEIERPLSDAEQLTARFEAQKEGFISDAAKYEALRRHTGPAAVTLLLFKALHSNIPEGLFVGSLKARPQEPGVFAVEIAGRSTGLDDAATLESLRILVDALKVLPEIENASSTTTEKKATDTDGVPFQVKLQLRYASTPPAGEEAEN